jgi:hypothetical protein
MAFQSSSESETLKRLAEASGRAVSDDQLPEIAAAYRGIAEDTRLLRAADLSAAVPATVFEAE